MFEKSVYSKVIRSGSNRAIQGAQKRFLSWGEDGHPGINQNFWEGPFLRVWHILTGFGIFVGSKIQGTCQIKVHGTN